MWRRHQGKNWALIVAECASGELLLQQAEGFGDGRLEMVFLEAEHVRKCVC